jgi:zinc transport system permease protein
MSYLFGNILMVARQDLWLMAALNLAIVVLTLLFYNKFLVICFHEELARLRGLRVGLYNLVLLLLTALTVVLLVQVVGIVMVIALLTLPAATATHFAGRLWQVMAVAVVVSILATLGGLAISYAPGWPAGATIIELAAAAYLGTLLAHGGWRRLQRRQLGNRQLTAAEKAEK